MGPNKFLMQHEGATRGISVGTLPFRYLGLPLTPKAWTRLDYEPLIDTIRSRLLAWSHRSLSFAWRLQLIKSVITNVINFWCAVFILPKARLDAIETSVVVFYGLVRRMIIIRQKFPGIIFAYLRVKVG